MTTTDNLPAVREGYVITPAERAAAATAAVSAGSIDSWLIVMKDVVALAELICDTEFVPKAYRGNAPAVAAAILAGRELGLQPMTALRHVQVVEGSPSLSAEYKRARVLAAGHKLSITERTAEACTVTGYRKGHEPVTVRFTMADARLAGLVESKPGRGPRPYVTRPRRMLFARACTEVVDALFADLTNGLPTTELMEDDGEGDELGGYAEQAPPPQRQRVTASQARARAPQRATGTVVPEGPSPAAPGTTEPAPPESHADAPPRAAAAGEAKDKVQAIWACLHQDYGYESGEAAVARAAAWAVAGREQPVKSLKELTEAEKSRVLDQLHEWARQAKETGERPRDILAADLASRDAGPAEEGESGGE